MTAITATLTCSQDEPAVEIGSVAQLELWLDKLSARCNPEFPGIFRLCAHGYKIELGFGLAESFVKMERESGMPPYYTTVGESSAEGGVGFYLFGARPTQIPRRHLIPMTQARQVVREFFETGHPSTGVRWEKVSE